MQHISSGNSRMAPSLGRRTSVVRTGSAFGGSVGDHLELYGYNPRNELTGAAAHEGTDPEAPGTAITARNREYEYDPIGNRQSSVTGSDPAVYYCANNVNVYTALDDAAGCSAPVTQAFTYDGDANMTGDGQWTYEWDWENRLREAREAGPVEGSKRLVFRYDHMNRRIRKEVFTYDATAEAWRTTPESDTRFIYDGWNLVMELDALDDDAVIRKYTWGLDLSGTRQGAGGIGGLLAAHDAAASKDYIVFSDANGNVGQIVDISDGSLAAKYEYDAYGNALVSDGPYADDNPFRFSTKYFDADTGLYYYGYRYYRPDIGRWVNRDPIEERGGVNLFTFALNTPVVRLDPIGRESEPTSAKASQSTACCVYKSEVGYIGTTGKQVTRKQSTQSCQAGATDPMACCKCPSKPLGSNSSGPGAYTEPSVSVTLESATRGGCCSCQLEVRRKPGGYPSHVLVLARCPSGDWYADHPPACSADLRLNDQGEPKAREFIEREYPEIVTSYAVSCTTADKIRSQADQLAGSDYNLIQDCYWYVRQLEKDKDNWILDE